MLFSFLYFMYFMIIPVFSSNNFEKAKFCSELVNILELGDDAIQDISNNHFFNRYSLTHDPESLEETYLRCCVQPTQQPSISVNRDKFLSILQKIQDDLFYISRYLFFKNHTEYPSLRQIRTTSDNWNYLE
jgi:hypothetical protein